MKHKGHGYHAQHGNHQKKPHTAPHKEMGTEGKMEASGNLSQGKHGEGLGSGYSPPDRYKGSEDSHNSHCC